MASDANPASPELQHEFQYELQHEIEQWYYREARMLDGREYQKWLALCDPAIRYIVPGRSNPLVDNADRGNEEHDLGRERTRRARIRRAPDP